MLRYSFFSLIFIFNFTILSCDKSVSTSGNKPSTVIFVTKTADTSVVERGIDAVPDGNRIRIEWFQNPEEEVERYNIYRSEENNDDFSLISNTIDTVYEDMVETFTKYYYYVSAETDEGMTSEPSDTISYMLLEKATLLSPDDTVNTGEPKFIWRDTNDPFYHEYIIRVVQVETEQTIWSSVKERESYDSDQEEIVFNADSEAAVVQLLPDILYKWRVDILGDEKKGSESNWKPILYRGEQ